MAIVRWIPFEEEFNNLRKSMDRMIEEFPSVGISITPAIDVYQTETDVVVETPLAGVNPKDVDVSVEDDVLTIKGEFKKKTEIKEKDYFRKEVREGKFSRSVVLPVSVKVEKAKAESENGILKIILPKKEVKPKAKAVKIEVKSKGK